MTVPTTVAEAQRDDPALTPADLISAYEQGVEELRLAVAGMTVEQLRSRPVAGRRSTLEVVCHIADCEQFFADRLKRTVALDRPLLLGVDGSRYPEPLRYQDHDLDWNSTSWPSLGDRRPIRSGWSPRTPGSAPPSTAKPAW